MDVFEIQQLINTYHEAAGTAEYDRLVATFAPDGVWEFTSTGSKFVGRSAIRDAVDAFTGAFEYIAQINAPAIIAVNGDTASARSSIRESGKFASRDEGIEAFGIYHDKLVRTAEGWRFARRTFELHWRHQVPILPA